MFKNLKLSKRLNLTSGEFDNQGSLFVNDYHPTGLDISGFNVLHFGIDTLKQKYRGDLDDFQVRAWLHHLQTNHSIEVDFIGHTFRFSKAPRVSGYRYMLVNKSLGIHLFFGSFHSTEWLLDAIAKVEFSPQIIYEHGMVNIYYICQHIADSLFIDGWSWAGVEGHIACDVQGWQPEQTFLENITTYSKIKRCFNTSNLVGTDLSTVAVRYGNSESFLIGKAGRSQLAVYNKLEEAKQSGKLNWWKSVYEQHPLFNPDLPIFRIELRLHDSVVKNLGNPETGENYLIHHVLNFDDHVQGLWRYGLFKLFRYHYEGSDLVRPEWQFLVESLVYDRDKPNDFFYKRVEAEIIDNTIQKNLEQAMGHLTSAFAKANIPDDQALTSLRRLPLYKHLCFMFEDKGMSKDTWEQQFLINLKARKMKFAHMIHNPFRHIPNYEDKGLSYAEAP